MGFTVDSVVDKDSNGTSILTDPNGPITFSGELTEQLRNPEDGSYRVSDTSQLSGAMDTTSWLPQSPPLKTEMH